MTLSLSLSTSEITRRENLHVAEQRVAQQDRNRPVFLRLEECTMETVKLHTEE